MIHLLLAESSLELVPKELWSHPAVWKNAARRGKKPGETILDASLHHQAMKNLKNREKRGRPDVVFLSLIEALSSPLNRRGMLRVYVHTLNNYVIYVDPTVRLPKDYRRFIGLMEQLLVEGKVPPGSEKPLLYVKTRRVVDVVREVNADMNILIVDRGMKVSVMELARKVKGKNVCFIVKGFPHGEFTEETLAVTDFKVSIYPEPLDAWCLISRILTAIEIVEGII